MTDIDWASAYECEAGPLINNADFLDMCNELEKLREEVKWRRMVAAEVNNPDGLQCADDSDW